MRILTSVLEALMPPSYGPAGATWQPGSMAVAGISHVTLSTRDATAAARFYTEVLGCETVARWPKGAYLLAGDLWIALVEGPVGSAGDDYSHVAFHVDRHRFAEVAGRIEASGATAWQQNWTEGESLYFTDLDGHRLEIHATTLADRLAHARTDPWPGLEIGADALRRARPSPSVADPRKPRRLACAPIGVFVVVADGDRVLLLRHPDDGRVEVPNGAMEPGEDPAATARRELREEAGRLDVGPMMCVAASNVDYHPHLPPLVSIGFVCAYQGGTAVAGDDMAGCTVEWRRVDEIDDADLFVPGDRATLTNALAYLRACQT